MYAPLENSSSEDQSPTRGRNKSNKFVSCGVAYNKTVRCRPRKKSRPGFTESTTLDRPRSTSKASKTIQAQLQNVSSSSELLSYYQHTMKRFSKENFDMQEKIDTCMSLCDFSHQLEQELTQRNEEVSCMQQLISDLQVNLFEERNQSLKLHAEVDKLTRQKSEDNKKIAFLLILSNTSEADLNLFMSSSIKSAICVPQKLPPKLQNYKGKLNVGPKVVSTSKALKSAAPIIPSNGLNTGVVSDKAQIMVTQLEKQIRLARDCVHSLIKDRDLMQREHKAERNRLQSHILSLASRLKSTQDKLCMATQDLLTLQEDYRSEEMKWVRQKEQMRHKWAICQEHLGDSLGCAVSCCGTSPKCSLPNKSGEISLLREELRDRESLVTLYRNQTVLLEGEMNSLRDQSETCKSLFKEKTRKMSDQVTYLKSNYIELNRRRILDAEGFHNDIKILRNRIQVLEKRFHKVSLNWIPSKLSQLCEKEYKQLETTAHDTMIKAKQLKQELQLIKNKIFEIESDKLN